MVRHIVLWKLKTNNETVFETVRAALQAQRIPGLLKTEIGRNFTQNRRAVDFALVMDFESREALAAYHKHPAHLATRAVVDPLAAEHWIADYELTTAS
jgi:heme-degrading monooxygenase HmoA